MPVVVWFAILAALSCLAAMVSMANCWLVLRARRRDEQDERQWRETRQRQSDKSDQTLSGQTAAVEEWLRVAGEQNRWLMRMEFLIERMGDIMLVPLPEEPGKPEKPEPDPVVRMPIVSSDRHHAWEVAKRERNRLYLVRPLA